MSSREHVIMWDLTTGKSKKFQVDEHKTALTDALVCFAENGTRLITVRPNDAIRVWDANSGVLKKTLQIQKWGISSFRPSSYDQGYIALVDTGGVRLWDVRDDSPLTLVGHTSFVYPVDVSPNGDRIASGGWDDTVRVWDLATGKEVWASQQRDGPILDLDFDEQGDRLVSGSSNGFACLWDVSRGELTQRSKVGRKVSGATFLGDDRVLLVHGDITLRDAQSLETIRRIPADAVYLGKDVQGKRFITRGDRAISRRKTVSLWNVAQMQPFATFESPLLVESATLTPDSKQLLLGLENGIISVWAVDQPERPLRTISAHSREVFALQFLDTPARLFSAGRDAIIRILDFETGDVVGSLRGHEDYVYSLAVTSDTRHVISGSGDHTVRIWETTPLRKRLHAIRK